MGWCGTFIMLVVVAIAVLATLPKPQYPAHERCNQYMPIETPAASVPIPAKKEYDVVVYGATGFTGSLVAKYLATKYDPTFKWAIAGRSQSKLDALKAEFNPAYGVGVIVADSNDPQSLEALMASTKVVITTVGPYTQYGTPLVEAAAKSGVHYCDLSGEPFWQRNMIDKYDKIARSTGAKIVLSAGFDSIPVDLGALFARNELRRIHDEPVADITALVTESRGWLSGGTAASAVITFKQIASGEIPLHTATDPYLLVPQDDAGVVANCRRDGEVSGWGNRLRYDNLHNALGLPHMMASINARIVRRSLALSGVRNVTYSEGASLGALADMFIFMLDHVLTGRMPLKDLLPSPGAGPSPSIMREGEAIIDFIASNAAGDKKVKTQVKFFGDPGYNATSKMLAETGVCLSSATCLSHGEYQGGGVVTPGAALGDGLIRRLQAAEGGKFFSFKTVSTN